MLQEAGCVAGFQGVSEVGARCTWGFFQDAGFSELLAAVSVAFCFCAGCSTGYLAVGFTDLCVPFRPHFLDSLGL